VDSLFFFLTGKKTRSVQETRSIFVDSLPYPHPEIGIGSRKTHRTHFSLFVLIGGYRRRCYKKYAERLRLSTDTFYFLQISPL